MEFQEGAVGLAVEPLHAEKFSDNSEAELGLITKKETRKRKRGSQTDASCSSSGGGSPLNLPYCLGYIGKADYDYSTDENSDGSRRSRSICRLPGYHSATTAIVTDSEDEIDFPNDVTDLDTFSVEYEPPETNSEDENDGDDSDEEQVIIIPSSSEDEDPGAEGGDEYDVDSDSEDSWECPECWTMNHPMTTKCLMCWKERMSLVQQLNSLADKRPTVPPSKTTTADEIKPATTILLEKTIGVSLSRSSSSCSSSTQASSDSGVCVSSCELDTHETVLHNEAAFKGASNTIDLTEDTSTSARKDINTIDEAVSQKNDTFDLCVICSTEPRNASIIHGRSGHQVCCITCAEKLKAAKKRCPVCRRRIHFVIKNFL